VQGNVPSCRLGVDAFAWFDRRGSDFDPARFQLLGNFTFQIDMQKAIAKLGADHFHMLGKLELALEPSARNATEQKLALFGFSRFPARSLDGKHILMGLD